MANERRIEWEDYNENYTISTDSSFEDLRDEDDVPLEDVDSDSDDYSDQEERVIRSSGPNYLFQAYNDTVFSPWGPIRKTDPFAPINFYSMRVMHTYGFAATEPWYSPVEFEKKLNGVEGIAAWKCLDPYCFIIAKARCYEWRSIVQQLNKAFDIGINKKVEEEIDSVIKTLIDSDVNKNTTFIRFSDGTVEQSTSNDPEYSSFINNVNILLDSGAPEGTVIIMDGEVKLR